VAAPRRLGQHDAQSQLDGRDPALADAKLPALRSGGHGEWSDTTQSIDPSTSACHSVSRFAADRMGGHHLNSVAPSGTSSAASAR
jgi:hypothetical protein